MAINRVDYYGETLIDLTQDTVTPSDVRAGVTFHMSSGVKKTGTYNLKSVIIAAAPTGSTVICRKGAETKTVEEKGGTWTFAEVDVGTWTVTATLGSNTASKSVTLTVLGEAAYVVLEYELHIIENGIISPQYDFNFSTGNVDKPVIVAQKSGYIEVTGFQSGQGAKWFNSQNVDLTNISNLYAEVESRYTPDTGEARFAVVANGVTDPAAVQRNTVAYTAFSLNDFSIQNATIDVSTLTGMYAVGLFNSQYSSDIKMKIYSIGGN